MSNFYVSRDVINTLRGLACIFLVFFHAVGSNQYLGLKISEGALRDLNDVLAYVRMPLFTFLSGVVYGLRPFSGDWVRFLRGKLRRLVLPLLFVGTAFAVLQVVFRKGGLGELAWIHIYPVAHFWFIQSLFWIFLCVAVVDGIKVGSKRTFFALIIGLALFLFLFSPRPEIFSISGVIYLLPFFC
jgi:surface polysaccharide O-acyltransferase-like enzyme